MDQQSDRRRGRFQATLPTQAYLLFVVATLLGLAHHVDHVIRGNHVGWPVTPAVNPFTYSLLIYHLTGAIPLPQRSEQSERSREGIRAVRSIRIRV